MNISVLNGKLQKLVKVFPHARFLETDNNRNLFTNHGLHLNKLGKHLFNHQIATLLLTTFEQKTSSPIILTDMNSLCIASLMVYLTMIHKLLPYQIFSILFPDMYFPILQKIGSKSISKFTFLLSYENWEDVFLEENVNIIFNNSLNTYLRISYASFPITKSQNSYKSKPWLTNGIRISCANKRKVYLTYRNSNDLNHKEYYKKYCQSLTTVIMAAKKLHYNKLLLKLSNKPKTTWNIVKTITSNKYY